MSDNTRAREQGLAQFESIKGMVADMTRAHKSGDDAAIAAALTTIQEDPLCIEVRSGWHTPSHGAQSEEFQILLCTGGPAVRIVGELNEYLEPVNPSIEYQDWYTPWERMAITVEDQQILQAYCQEFYYGE